MGHWRPPAGTTTLIESEDLTPITAVVLDDDDRLLVDIGSSAAPESDAVAVVASFFTPDALLRVVGKLVVADDERGQYELVVSDLERVQRRKTRRVDIDLPCSLTAPEAVVKGHTLNVSAGGCRVQTDRMFPSVDEPIVSLQLADGETVVAVAYVVARAKDGDTWDYRLMFTDIDPGDRDRLAHLAEAA